MIHNWKFLIVIKFGIRIACYHFNIIIQILAFKRMYFYSPYYVFPTQSCQLLPYCWTNFNFYTNNQENTNRIQEQNSLSTQSDHSKELEIVNIDQPIKPSKFNESDQKLVLQSLVTKQKKYYSLQITQSKHSNTQQNQSTVKSCKKRKSATKLTFQTEWKNQNRNIVPNIMNQLISYLEKSHKSQKLIQKLFRLNPHQQEWTLKKFYFYMKLMKNKLGHYINENQLSCILKIQEKNCQIYSYEQQCFYLKICRITVDYFLSEEVILIALTSKRMSQQKRKAHLIARKALLQRFQELLFCEQ